MGNIIPTIVICLFVLFGLIRRPGEKGADADKLGRDSLLFFEKDLWFFNPFWPHIVSNANITIYKTFETIYYCEN